MNEHILWSKIARIIMQLAETLDITSERAMKLFYESDVCAMLHEPKYGLHLMSDTYIVNDIIEEWQRKQEQTKELNQYY